MLEHLLNGQFDKSAALSCKYLCGYILLFFYDFLMCALIFMNMQI